MAFIDGVLIPVPDANKSAFIDMARDMASLFIACGATDVVDTWAVDVPDGDQTSLPMAVALKDGESVTFGWVEWPSKEARDAGWAKAMEDPRMKNMAGDMFDGKRMIFGGFEIVQRTRKGD